MGTPLDDLLAIAKDKMGVETMKEVHLISGIPASAASKVRHGHIPLSAEMILRLHDVSGVSVDEIRERLGIKKYSYVGVQQNAQQTGDKQSAQN
jgi:hypothetical protein